MKNIKKQNKIRKIIIIIFIIFSLVFITFFIQNKNSKENFLAKKIIITKEKFLKNPEKISKIIINKNAEKIVKIISKKKFTIYKNNDYFQTPIENYIINNKIINWFFITNNWIILTNKHILEEENIQYIWITNDKKKYKLKLLWFSKNEDLAIFKISNIKNNFFSEKVEFVENNKKIKNNDFIFSLNSNKKIFSWKIINKNSTQEIIDNFYEKNIIKNLLETNLKNNLWDSGSPVFNLNQKVIWINSFIKNNKTYSIYLDDEKIRKILKALSLEFSLP